MSSLNKPHNGNAASAVAVPGGALSSTTTTNNNNNDNSNNNNNNNNENVNSNIDPNTVASNVIPRDVRLLHLIFATQGIQNYQDHVPLQLMDFAHSMYPSLYIPTVIGFHYENTV